MWENVNLCQVAASTNAFDELLQNGMDENENL